MKYRENTKGSVGKYVIRHTSYLIPLCLLIVIPDIVHAAPKSFIELSRMGISIINSMVAVLSSVALMLFLWGIVMYIYSSASAESKSQSKMFMYWGIIALFVLTSVWGRTGLVKNTFLGSGSASATKNNNPTTAP
jgi:uncharacterized membrane protein YozB (DUF420 family)